MLASLPKRYGVYPMLLSLANVTKFTQTLPSLANVTEFTRC
jgi:hypothetical protein